jgi:hypothetical protein
MSCIGTIDGQSTAVSVHVGAHKTATTYIQAVLELNADALAGAGVAYIPLPRMRTTVTHQVWWPNSPNLAAAEAEIRARMSAASGQPRRLLLSDENLIGTPPADLATHAFYPKARAHLARLVELLGIGSEPTLFLAVRTYDRFIPAMYAEVLRHREFLSFDEYVDRLDLDTVSWFSLVEELCAVVPAGRLTLWRYEDFAALERSIFAEMAPEAAVIELKTPADPQVRPSPPMRAVQALAALRQVLDDREVQRLVGPIYEHVTGGPPFRPFARTDAEHLQSRYRADLALIQREHPEVRWLRPD